MASQFITINSLATQGALGTLIRGILIFSREVVAGFTADTKTGLYKITSTQEEAFKTANPTSLALISALEIAFGQSYLAPFVFILSEPTGLTTALLDKANRNPRDWSFITIADEFQGDGEGASGGDTTNFFADLGVMNTWDLKAKKKICSHTYSVEEISNNPIVLATELATDGVIRKNANIKTIVSNSHKQADIYAPFVYDNISLAQMVFCLFGAAISRSWGSLSDAHDFNLVSEDTYGDVSRALIESNSLGQYNGAKDKANSNFVYDTQMNANENPPLTVQIETLAAQYFTEDYVYVYVHNDLQRSGQTGLPTDNAGIQRVLGLIQVALQNCFGFNAILAKDDGSPDFSLSALTAKQVTALSPNWQTTGIWPPGVITGQIKYFAATHYISFDFFS